MEIKESQLCYELIKISLLEKILKELKGGNKEIKKYGKRRSSKG